MTDLLVSLGDENESVPTINTSSTSSVCSIGTRMAANRPDEAQRDSFSDLANLMKAKKPYTLSSTPTPKPRVSLPTNAMQFGIGEVAGCSLLSPLARPFQAPGSVAAFLHEQELASPTASPPSEPEYRKRDIQHLESLAKRLRQYEIADKTDHQPCPQTPLPPAQELLLIPNLQSPVQVVPANTPTSVESLQPTLSAFHSSPEPVVHLTKPVWDSMGADLQMLMTQKRALEDRLAHLERSSASLRRDEHDIGAQMGKLRYQNEANKDQKAAMGRSLALQEVEIKKLQLDNEDLAKKLAGAECELKKLGEMTGELEYLRDVKISSQEAQERSLIDLAATKDRKLEDLRSVVHKLEEELRQVILERDAVLRAQITVGDHATRAQNLADTLAKREKIITDLRQKHLEEQMKAADLEDEVEMLKSKANQESIDDMREKLLEKTSQCDRLRNQLKLAELHLKASQERVLRAANDGESLRGAAHLVCPNPKSKLPKSVVSCSECYANNLTCDSNACCRNCTDSNTKCARWRCSLKHRLGECPMVPCKLPHDDQGWLIQKPRPEW